MFTRVYRDRSWGKDSQTFFSGPGSNDEAAKPYTDFITQFIATRGITQVVDLGCGDFRVGRLIAESGVNYIGVDVVKPLIEENSRRYGSDTVRFQLADITTDTLPKGDLCLVREVFQHLSNKQVLAILDKLSEYEYALITDVYPENPRHYRVNRDKPHGKTSRLSHFSLLSLDSPPFNRASAKLVLEVDPSYREGYPVFGRRFKLRTFMIERT